MAGLSDAPFMQSLAVPAVCSLIAYLAYFSQYLLQTSSLEPGPPSRKETIVFNFCLVFLWYAYFKAVTEDPGRYVFPLKRAEETGGNWCKKCAAPKPARAHHCRHCGRCIPKMDHHCPWTANCVSMTTFPHFLRFLVFANVSLWILGFLLWQRFHSLWEARHLPAYLGPTLPALIGLAVTSLICFFTSLALGIMLATTAKSWLFNCTMIEGWQLERHEAVLDRGGRDWWDFNGPDGMKIRFERVEFPYDLGIWANMSQAMGTSNFLLWLCPFAGNPKVGQDGKGTGWEWEENGFNPREGMWPPLDPEKIQRADRQWPAARRDYAAEMRDVEPSSAEQICAFRERQLMDTLRPKTLLAELEEDESYGLPYAEEDEFHRDDWRDWRNDDGEYLTDYGVDEEAEDFCTAPIHQDDVPLAEFLRRRKHGHNGEID
ncbi:hypothetical protein UVI_02002610 [Ustilaginoidea virens]|nr:hypothetical protein UVI_02002610 [Ustilaginoidea virens]